MFRLNPDISYLYYSICMLADFDSFCKYTYKLKYQLQLIDSNQHQYMFQLGLCKYNILNCLTSFEQLIDMQNSFSDLQCNYRQGFLLNQFQRMCNNDHLYIIHLNLNIQKVEDYIYSCQEEMCKCYIHIFQLLNHIQTNNIFHQHIFELDLNKLHQQTSNLSKVMFVKCMYMLVFLMNQFLQTDSIYHLSINRLDLSIFLFDSQMSMLDNYYYFIDNSIMDKSQMSQLVQLVFEKCNSLSLNLSLNRYLLDLNKDILSMHYIGIQDKMVEHYIYKAEFHPIFEQMRIHNIILSGHIFPNTNQWFDHICKIKQAKEQSYQWQQQYH